MKPRTPFLRSSLLGLTMLVMACQPEKKNITPEELAEIVVRYEPKQTETIPGGRVYILSGLPFLDGLAPDGMPIFDDDSIKYRLLKLTYQDMGTPGPSPGDEISYLLLRAIESDKPPGPIDRFKARFFMGSKGPHSTTSYVERWGIDGQHSGYLVRSDGSLINTERTYTELHEFERDILSLLIATDGGDRKFFEGLVEGDPKGYQLLQEMMEIRGDP